MSTEIIFGEKAVHAYPDGFTCAACGSEFNEHTVDVEDFCVVVTDVEGAMCTKCYIASNEVEVNGEILINDGDYKLRDGCGWFEVDDFAVRITRTDSGIRCAVYQCGNEDGDELGYVDVDTSSLKADPKSSDEEKPVPKSFQVSMFETLKHTCIVTAMDSDEAYSKGYDVIVNGASCEYDTESIGSDDPEVHELGPNES